MLKLKFRWNSRDDQPRVKRQKSLTMSLDPSPSPATSDVSASSVSSRPGGGYDADRDITGTFKRPWDITKIPGYNQTYVNEASLDTFASYLKDDEPVECASPVTSEEVLPLGEKPVTVSQKQYITSKHDWTPVFSVIKAQKEDERRRLVRKSSKRRLSSHTVLNKDMLQTDFKHYIDLYSQQMEEAEDGKRKKEKKEKKDAKEKEKEKEQEKIKEEKEAKIVKRVKKSVRDEIGEGIGFKLFRWPALMLISMWLLLLTSVYAVVRVFVAGYENILTWRGKRAKLRKVLRSARTYEQWVAAAKDLDNELGNSAWREDPKFGYYDHATIAKLTKMVRRLRKEDSVEDLANILQGCLKNNFAGTESSTLYSQTYYGTKKLVEIWNEELGKAVTHVMESPKIDDDEKRDLFRLYSKNFGKSALCLSGGGCFAYLHFGIVKAMLDQDLLPQIISGTSGGALIAALACTRTDDELRQILVPELAYKITACWEPFPKWCFRWWRTGARFDSCDWARRSAWFTLGDMTFKEAYQRTGRILNVSTVPADPHSPVILCNYITSPDCIIWSTLLASAAVPGILNPVVLLNKTKTGEIVPFSFGSKWKDGSLRTDIPVDALNTYFNVNCSIVSQVNPHIALFFYAPRGTVGRPVSHRKGKGWRGGFLGAALESMIKLEIRKWLKFIKAVELLPRFVDQDWTNVWLQRFSGSVTLWPKINLSDFWHILGDPWPEKMEDLLYRGQQCAFPKLLFLKHRLNIEKRIRSGRQATRQRKRKSDELTHGSGPGSLTLDIPGASDKDHALVNLRKTLSESDPDSDVKHSFVFPALMGPSRGADISSSNSDYDFSAWGDIDGEGDSFLTADEEVDIYSS